MNYCRRGHDKDITGRYKDGRCRVCRRKSNRRLAQAYRLANPHAATQKSRLWRAANPERNRAYQREWARKNRYDHNYIKRLIRTRRNHLRSSIELEQQMLEVALNGFAQNSQ
jgi:hypothetical protein